jgi:hypothetical protein
MEQDPNKLIEEQFNSLPDSLQSALKGVPWKDEVSRIASSNALSSEQAFALEEETLFVLYGLEAPEDYIANLVSEALITEDQAIIISDIIAERVFEPIMSKAEELSLSGLKHEGDSENLPKVAPEIHPMPIKETGLSASSQAVPALTPTTETNSPNTAMNQIRSWKTDTEQGKAVDIPDYRYPDDVDPYREQHK